MVLIFCKDGHLRIKHELNNSDDFPLLNLETLYELLDSSQREAPIRFWKHYWNLPVSFEDGLTFRNFFMNLEPWVDFFQDVIPHAVNLKTFIQEIKKPSLTFKGSNPINNQEPLCDLIVLNQFTTLSPIMHREGNSKNTYLPITETTGKWSIQHNMPLVGIYRDLRPETFNIENTQLNLLANKPILLNKNHYLLFDNYNRDVIKKNKIPEHIFNNDSYGVFQYNEFQHAIISERNISLLDILNNIFKFFFTCPDERDISLQEIDKFLASMSDEETQNLIEKETEDFDDTLIEANIISNPTTDDYEIKSIMQEIQDINNKGNIATFGQNLGLQKNAFSFMDYKIHLLKSSIDEKMKKITN